MKPRTVIPATIIGAVIGVAIGYALAKLTGFGSSFIVWAGFDPRFTDQAEDALAWAVGGAIVGAAAAYLWSPKSK